MRQGYFLLYFSLQMIRCEGSTLVVSEGPEAKEPDTVVSDMEVLSDEDYCGYC